IFIFIGYDLAFFLRLLLFSKNSLSLRSKSVEWEGISTKILRHLYEEKDGVFNRKRCLLATLDDVRRR
ncbi:MAG: hypothetical protein M0P33_08480, partial [Massilibacteroides sp.]|nr:hypothetical protein [Massilibacteroides sp.]